MIEAFVLVCGLSADIPVADKDGCFEMVKPFASVQECEAFIPGANVKLMFTLNVQLKEHKAIIEDTGCRTKGELL